MQVEQRTSIPHLFRDLSADVSHLVRQEVELAKAEMTEKATRMTRRIASIAVAGGVLLAAGLALLAAVIYGLTALLDTFLPLGVAVWLAPLLLALALGAVGYGLLQSATAALKSESLAPTATVETLQENKQWLKSRTN
jgi:hypothetical protein